MTFSLYIYHKLYFSGLGFCPVRILKRDLAGVGLLSRPYILSDKSRVKQAG